MSMAFILIKRNIKLFFKDKGMFFTSLITPAILLVLYVTFLGNVYRDSFTSNLPNSLKLSESIIEGLVGGQLNTEIAGIRYRCLIAFRYRRNYRRIHYVHCQAGKLQSGDWYRCCQLRTYHRKSCPEDSKQGQSGFVRSGRCLGSQYLRSNHLSYYYGYLYYDYPLFIA